MKTAAKSSDDCHKKLSFFADDDDEDDEKSDRSPCKSPNSIKKLRSCDKELSSTIDNAEEGIGKCSSRVTGSKTAQHISTDDDDASSTGSCSCEDHSSVAGQSDDLHEDLDYDEDSVTASPPRESRNDRLLTERIDQTTSSSSDRRHPGSNILNPGPEANESSTDPSNTSPPKHESHADDRDSSSPMQESCRIKSVINFNHRFEQRIHSRSSESAERGRANIGSESHESYESLLKYFFRDARYFQIKSINYENVELSKNMGVWSTQVLNEVRLNAAFRMHRNVILIFSVQQSGAFQGFARMVSESRHNRRSVPWILPERLRNRSLGGVFKVEWLCRNELPFYTTHNLYNPLNGNKPVKVARDGQEVDPEVGEELCRLFPPDSKDRLQSSLATLKRQSARKKKASHRRDDIRPTPSRRNDIGERHRRNDLQPADIRMLDCQRFSGANANNIDYNPRFPIHRPVGRRRILDEPFNHGVYHNQALVSPLRPYHMPRNPNAMPQCLMANNHIDFHHNQVCYPPLDQYHNHHCNLRISEPYTTRFHPYQRPH